MNKPKNHGGKRAGAGRPKKEPTVLIRVPAKMVEQMKNFIKLLNDINK